MPRALAITVLILCARATFAQDCTVPDALLTAGFVDDAKTAYAAILKGDDTATPPEVPTDAERACATAGLERTRDILVATKLAVGDLYRTAGDAEAAAEQYKGVLELDPSSAAASRGVTLLQPVTAVERARKLSQLGLHDEALGQLNAALTSDAGLREAIPEDLAYLFDGPPSSWDAWRLEMTGWGPAILEVAAAVVLLLVLWRMGKSAWHAWRRSLDIEEFDKGGFEGDHVGKHFATAVRSRLHRTVTGSSRGRIDLITGPIQSVQLPAQVEGIVPPVGATWFTPIIQAIPALLAWLTPTRTLKLNGVLHIRGENGVGVTAQLVDRLQIVESYTFRQKDFDDEDEPSTAEEPEAVDQIAEYVAIWLVFETSKHFGKPLWLLGTSNWRSYALFRAGVFAEDEERAGAAKRLYVRALQIDPKLRGARFNLAKCLWREGDRSGAMEQYKRVMMESQQAPGGDRDPSLYSAMYNMAISVYIEQGAQSAEPLLAELLEKIEHTQELIDAYAKHYRDATLREHLEKIRPIVAVALGGLRVELGDANGLALFERESRVSDFSPLLQFNLACSYSVAAQKAAPINAPRYVILSFEFLERAFKLDAALANKAKADGSLAHVRAADTTRFDALVKKYSEPGEPVAAPAEPLAEYKTIGDAYAKELTKNNITTTAELLQSTILPADRQKLASALAVGTPLVTIWAHAMDLSRIVGMKPAHVNLLALAGVSSLAELKNANSAALTTTLASLATAADETDVPDAATVQTWISDAGTNTRTKVL